MATATLLDRVQSLAPALAQAAAEIYHAWDASDPEFGDAEHGFGGICDAVSQEMGDILAHHDIDTAEAGQTGDGHAWLIAYDEAEAVEVDLPYHHYETGGGYEWQKIPDVKIIPEMLEIHSIQRPEGIEEAFND